MSAIVITIPGLHTISEANAREHHMAKASRKRLHTDTARAHVLAARAWMPFPVVVTLTRIGAKRLDSDNLAGSFKGVQDGVALARGVDDGDPRITWVYQQRCERKQAGIQRYAVEIRIEARL